jgi:hypothetical protein
MMVGKTFQGGARCVLPLLLLVVLCGCPEEHLVTVQIKPDAAATAAAGNSAESPSSAGAEGYGNLLGQVTLEGAAPEPRKLIAAGDQSVKDPAVCAAVDLLDEKLMVDPASNGIANVVVYLDKPPASIKPELRDVPTDPVFFDQKGCRFFPRVLAFRAGQPLLVISDDDVPHNTHTKPNRNPAFNQTISPKDRKGVPCLYKKAEAAPIGVTCDFHTWMRAYHFPVDHPYFAVTDQQGRFRIAGLPAGKHNLNVWQESVSGGMLARKVSVTIEADKDTEQNFSFGAARFSARPTAASRLIAFERLLQGGEVIASQSR